MRLKLWAIGRTAGKGFVILEQDWLKHRDCAEPVWVLASPKCFESRARARVYLASANGLENPTCDTVVGGVVDAEPAIRLQKGKYFAKVSPALEYLIRT